MAGLNGIDDGHQHERCDRLALGATNHPDQARHLNHAPVINAQRICVGSLQANVHDLKGVIVNVVAHEHRKADAAHF